MLDGRSVSGVHSFPTTKEVVSDAQVLINRTTVEVGTSRNMGGKPPYQDFALRNKLSSGDSPMSERSGHFGFLSEVSTIFQKVLFSQTK